MIHVVVPSDPVAVAVAVVPDVFAVGAGGFVVVFSMGTDPWLLVLFSLVLL